jgi:signal transduction histidine kinase
MFSGKALNYIFIISVFIAIIFPLLNIYYIYPSFSDILTESTEEEATRLATHLRPAVVSEKGTLKRPDDFFRDLDNLEQEFGLMKLKVFSEKGETIYSSDPEDIGLVNKGSAFHNVVAKGNIYATAKSTGTRSVEGDVVTTEVVETYVPIMNGNTFLGAFEIYYDISLRKSKLDDKIFLFSVMPFAMMLSFLAVIIIILSKANKNIIMRKNVEQELRRHRDSLEDIVDERTKKLKESHAQLIQSEKLSSMGKLAGYLAHEINNPIGIIVSRAECILMDAEDEGYPEHILKDIEVMRKHSHRIASITNNMLSFTRKSSLDFRPTDINNVIDDTLLFIEKRFVNSKIHVRKEMDYTIPRTLGNANQLQQVLLNIFNNARDSMPEGGEMTIRSAYHGENIINMSISDSGTGIDDENLSKIFEPFFTTKEVGKGTGLGLSVVYSIIEDHQGHIAARSTIGKGTTFEIELPVTNDRITEEQHNEL